MREGLQIKAKEKSKRRNVLGRWKKKDRWEVVVQKRPEPPRSSFVQKNAIHALSARRPCPRMRHSIGGPFELRLVVSLLQILQLHFDVGVLHFALVAV